MILLIDIPLAQCCRSDVLVALLGGGVAVGPQDVQARHINPTQYTTWNFFAEFYKIYNILLSLRSIMYNFAQYYKSIISLGIHVLQG